MTKVSIRTKKLIQNIVGDGRLLPDQFREHFLLPIVYTISVSVVVLMLSVNIITSIDVDTLPAFASFIGSLTLMVWMITYWHFVINSQRFYLLLDNMRHLVEGSVYFDHFMELWAVYFLEIFLLNLFLWQMYVSTVPRNEFHGFVDCGADAIMPLFLRLYSWKG